VPHGSDTETSRPGSGLSLFDRARRVATRRTVNNARHELCHHPGAVATTRSVWSLVDLQARRYLADVRAHLAACGFDSTVNWLAACPVLELETPSFSEWEGTVELVWHRTSGWTYRGLLTDQSPSRLVNEPLPVPVFAAPWPLGRWLHRLVIGDLDIPVEVDLWPGVGLPGKRLVPNASSIADLPR
jgi:hypothetical protein